MGFPCIREHSWSVLRRDGVPRLRSTTHDGAALIAARRGRSGSTRSSQARGVCTRLVVLAGEVGGWWSEGPDESPASAREGSPGVAAQMGVSLGLQRGQTLCPFSPGGRSGLGSDGDTPLTTEVISDHRYLPFTG